MLSLSGVTKQIGGLTAVDNVDLQMDADEIVGLVGPNGAGKTTLFNLVAGSFPPSRAASASMAGFSPVFPRTSWQPAGSAAHSRPPAFSPA